MAPLSNAEADHRVLVALFRTDLAQQNKHKSARARFAEQLSKVRSQLLDGWGSPDAGFPQQVCDDHGPALILRALADAYENPAHVMDDEVLHP
jgi:hypothetical protein